VVGAGKGEAFQRSVAPNSLKDALAICGLTEPDVRSVAKALAGGKKLTVFAGELVSRSKERERIAAALCNLNVLFGLADRGQIAALARYANSKGAQKLGLLPEPAPAIKAELAALWGGLPEAEPCTLDKIMANMRKEEVDGFIVMGANPVMLYPEREFVKEALERLDFLVVADLFETETTELADVVLPLASFAEYPGDYVNLEGRVQGAEPALKPRHESKPGYEILELLARKMDAELFADEAERDSEITRLLAVDSSSPLPSDPAEVRFEPEEHDDEYPVVLIVNDDPHHCGHLTEKTASLVNFCGEAYAEMSPELAEQYGLTNGSSVRIESPGGKIVLPVRISDHIDTQVVIVPRNFASTPVNALLQRKQRLDYVKLSKAAD
jgi:NADH-quinone oxidoreductase subunit G